MRIFNRSRKFHRLKFWLENFVFQNGHPTERRARTKREKNMGADGDAAAAKRAKLAARFGDDGGDGVFGFGSTATVGFGTTTAVNDGFLKSSASASAAGTTTTVPTSGDANGKRKTPTTAAATSYVCEAGDALRFYPWSGGGAVEAKEDDAFEPEFTHQVFREDETIFGYAGLKLDVHVCASSLKAMVKVNYEGKISSAMNPPDPVEEQLREWFDCEGLTELYADEAKFRAEAEMAAPCAGGTTLAEYETDGVVTRITAYELATSDEVKKWHAAMEAYAVFFIDAFSKIDNEDNRWTLVVATRHHPDGRWETAGFTTVYRFYSYPDSERARLSQILVLPPYQRQGLGGKLLEAVRKLAIDRKMRDLTIEDPTDQLQRLRDVHDVKACLKMPEMWTKVQAAAVNAARAPSDAARCSALACTKEIYDMAATTLKICKPQMRRVWEALLFIFAKRSNAPENSPVADAFKELIIRRLKALYSSDSDKNIGNKRIIPIGKNDFVMTKARGVAGEAPQLENPDDGQPDLTEVLGDLFHETVQNLNFIFAQCKNC